MNKKKVEQDPVVNQSETLFERDRLITSKALKKFKLHRDILTALLPNEHYSLKEAETIIQNYIDSF